MEDLKEEKAHLGDKPFMIVAVAFFVMIIAVVALNCYNTQSKVSEIRAMVKDGTNPQEANCAVYGCSDDLVFKLVRISKEVKTKGE
jgi:hypothetical protein